MSLQETAGITSDRAATFRQDLPTSGALRCLAESQSVNQTSTLELERLEASFSKQSSRLNVCSHTIHDSTAAKSGPKSP